MHLPFDLHGKPLLEGFIRSLSFPRCLCLLDPRGILCPDNEMHPHLGLLIPLPCSPGAPGDVGLGVQTIFYFVILIAEETRGWKTVKKWSIVISAVDAFKQSFLENSTCISSDAEDNKVTHQKLQFFLVS